MSKYYKDETTFEAIDNEQKAYFLGLLMSDGHVTKDYKNDPSGLCIALMDEDVIIKFKEFFKCNYPIKTFQFDRCQKMYRINICSRKIAKDVEKYGLIIKKTHRTKIENVPDHLIRHFIRGYFDGDGCLYTRKNRNCRTALITSSSYHILKQIQEYCLKNKLIRERNYVNKHNKNCWEFRLDNRIEIYKFLTHIYKDSIVYMNRKYNHYLEIKDIPLTTKRLGHKNKYLGVGMQGPNSRTKIYAAKLGHNGIRYNLGSYDTAEEAALAYNNKIIELGLPETMLNKLS